MAWTERYITTAGAGAHDGTSEANAWTLAEGIAGVAAGHRANIKAGTYANTTTDRNFATNGTTTAPVWLRGYSSAIGDLDADFATAKPAITFTTGRFIITGNYYIASNLNISGAQVTNGQVRLSTGDSVWFDRCRFECTAANAAGVAVSCAMTRGTFTRCWFKATSSAPGLQIDGVGGHTVLGCAFEGGSNGCFINGATNIALIANAFISTGGDAIRNVLGSRVWAILNSVRGSASDGIELATTIPTYGMFAGNIFGSNGGYGINNSTGANSANIPRLLNDFYSNTSGTETGFGDFPSLTEKSESSDPFTSSTDLSLVSAAVARQLFPGLFENESFTGYGDLGAVQAVAAAAGGPVGQCCM